MSIKASSIMRYK